MIDGLSLEHNHYVAPVQLLYQAHVAHLIRALLCQGTLLACVYVFNYLLY